MRRLGLLALALLALLPATASARFTPLPGTGQTPAVAIDRSGTALVAWYTSTPTGDQLALCRIPPRGGCPAPQILDATPGVASGVQPPLLRIDGPNVALVAARGGAVSLRSADGGATWGPIVPISTTPYFTGAIGADGTVVLGIGAIVTATKIDGPLVKPRLLLNPGFTGFQAFGFAGNRPVYISGGRAPRTEVSYWSGQGRMLDGTTWLHRPGPPMVFYDLASGPRGLWLVHERRVRRGDQIVVRRFRKGRFQRPRAIPRSTGSVLGTAIAQDAKGRLAVAWFDSNGNRVRVSASRNGRRWSRARTLGSLFSFPSVMSIGLGRGGRGLVAADQGLATRPVVIHRIDVRAMIRRR